MTNKNNSNDKSKTQIPSGNDKSGNDKSGGQ
jgi:hypothetical protein